MNDQAWIDDQKLKLHESTLLKANKNIKLLARKFGIHSAMPCSRAYKLCPQAIFVPPRFDSYRAASQIIRDIFWRYASEVEPLSLDEAYLDVTY